MNFAHCSEFSHPKQRLNTNGKLSATDVTPTRFQIFRLPYLKRPVRSDSIPTRGVHIASATWPINRSVPAVAFENFATL